MKLTPIKYKEGWLYVDAEADVKSGDLFELDYANYPKTGIYHGGEIEGVIDIMDVEDNNGESTAEIYYEMDSAFGNEEIYNNSNK